MPNTLFKSVLVNNSLSPFNGQHVDLLLSEDSIQINPTDIPNDCEIQSIPKLAVSAGWVDIAASIGEPGFEQRESIYSLQNAAAQGGYTDVFVLPEGQQAIDSKALVESLICRARPDGPQLHWIGAVSQQKKGEQIAELADMNQAGVKLYSDGLKPIKDSKLLQVALDYLKPFGGLILTQPNDQRLSHNAQIHEGIVSTMLGVQGFPAAAEEIGLQRDIAIANYRKSPLHVLSISLAKSLKTCLTAKQNHPLSFGIAVLNLLLNHNACAKYDVDTKVIPPLRLESDRKALVDAILSEQADALISNHHPHEQEAKKVEFPYAAFGASTIEIAFAIAATATQNPHLIARYFGEKNRTLVDLNPVIIEENNDLLNLSFYLPDHPFVVEPALSESLGTNIACKGMTLKGKPYASFCKGKLYYNH